MTQLPGVPQLPQFLAYMQSHGIKAAASGVQNGVMKCFFFCRQQGSQSLMLTDTVVDMATGRCETTAKLESPALEAAFRATFGQLLAAMR